MAEASQPSFTLFSVLVEPLPLPAPVASSQIANVGLIMSLIILIPAFFFFQREALKNYKQQEAICLGGGVWGFFLPETLSGSVWSTFPLTLAIQYILMRFHLALWYFPVSSVENCILGHIVAIPKNLEHGFQHPLVGRILEWQQSCFPVYTVSSTAIPQATPPCIQPCSDSMCRADFYEFWCLWVYFQLFPVSHKTQNKSTQNKNESDFIMKLWGTNLWRHTWEGMKPSKDQESMPWNSIFIGNKPEKDVELSTEFSTLRFIRVQSLGPGADPGVDIPGRTGALWV